MVIIPILAGIIGLSELIFAVIYLAKPKLKERLRLPLLLGAVVTILLAMWTVHLTQ